jgi:hypothetical protein
LASPYRRAEGHGSNRVICSEITRRAGIQPAWRPEAPEQIANPLNFQPSFPLAEVRAEGKIAGCSLNVSRKPATFVPIFQEVTT